MEPISFEQTLQYIVADFFNTFNIPPISIKYSITDDMAKSYTELRPLHAAKEPEKIATLNRYNGTTVAPNTVDGMFSVLLNQKYLLESTQQDNANWVGTIVHETTHAVDFTNFAALTGAPNYEDILSVSKNAMFQLWTEINARSKGYYFVRKYTFGDDMFNESQIDDIVNIEIPAQEKLLYQNYHATTDGIEQAYLVSHYLGRLYTLQQIFPNHFTDKQVKALIPPNPWMYEWFLFFKSHNTLELAYPDFESMKNILRKNFQGL